MYALGSQSRPTSRASLEVKSSAMVGASEHENEPANRRTPVQEERDNQPVN